MINIDPDKFAQAVVASHSNSGISKQLKEYVAAYKMAQEYNTEANKTKSSKLVEQDHKKDIQKLKNAGLI